LLFIYYFLQLNYQHYPNQPNLPAPLFPCAFIRLCVLFYRKMNRYIRNGYFSIICTVILLGIYPSFLPAGEIAIRGFVADSLTQEGISDVNISVKDTDIGTTTETTGYFNLELNNPNDRMLLVFKHIAYKEKQITIGQLRKQKKVVLVPENILLDEVRVEAKRPLAHYEQEIQNIISIYTEEKFEARGYTDAADVLNSDQSISIDENLNGTKQISVRGANENEILILYDGIKINSSYNNLFDLSMIDPTNLQQIDVIKGSNATIYGTSGNAAVINFIPKTEQDYLLKFQQRFGSYNSGNWGVQFYKNLLGVKLFSSVNQGGTSLHIADSEEYIRNTANDYLFNVAYDFGKQPDENKKYLVKAKYMVSDRDYDNPQYDEKLSNTTKFSSIRFEGNLVRFGKTNLTLSQNDQSEDYSWQTALMNTIRKMDENSVLFNAQQSIRFKTVNLFFNYQYDRSNLSFRNNHLDPDVLSSQAYPFDRKLHDFSYSVQFLNGSGSELPNFKEFVFNMDFKRIDDHLSDSLFSANDRSSTRKLWNESSYTVTLTFENVNPKSVVLSYFTYGIYRTIPTLYQQVQYYLYKANQEMQNLLLPEDKRTAEYGITLTDNMNSAPKYQLTAALFHSSYDNKFREIHFNQSPITYFDNHSSANITGSEAIVSVSPFGKICAFNFSVIKYFSMNTVAFPFKSDQKFTADIVANYKKLNAEFVWINESAREGQVIDENGQPNEIRIDKYSNIDVHLKYSASIWRTQCFVSFSGRNLIDKELVVQGIALYDRRFYFTFGFEFK